MKRFILLHIFFIFFINIISYCKKQKDELHKYQEACKKIAECDKSLPEIRDIEEHCSKFLFSIEKQKPEVVSPIVDCIKNTTCEELTLAKCVESNIRELQNLIPGKTN